MIPLHFHPPATVRLAQLANQLHFLKTFVLPNVTKSRLRLQVQLAETHIVAPPEGVESLLLRLAQQRLGEFDEALVQAAIAEVRDQMARVGTELLQEYRDACAFAGVDAFTGLPLTKEVL